jgi:hypothetical protein
MAPIIVHPKLSTGSRDGAFLCVCMYRSDGERMTKSLRCQVTILQITYPPTMIFVHRKILFLHSTLLSYLTHIRLAEEFDISLVGQMCMFADELSFNHSMKTKSQIFCRLVVCSSASFWVSFQAAVVLGMVILLEGAQILGHSVEQDSSSRQYAV